MNSGLYLGRFVASMDPIHRPGSQDSTAGFANGSAPSPEQLAAIRRNRNRRFQGKSAPQKGGRPTDEQVLKRYKSDPWDKLLRPRHTGIFDMMHPEEDGRSWGPGGCSGPYGKRRGRGRLFPCEKYHFCGFHWEARCRWASLMAMVSFLNQPNVWKFSLSLPGIREDPEAVLEARRKISEALRYRGFTRQFIFIQEFGDNPLQGVKGHLDGIIAGPDPDVGILDVRHNDSLRKTLKPFHARPDGGYWNEYIHHKPLDTSTLTAQLRDLYNKGRYAGRPTFPVRRILAGLYYQDGLPRVRLTNVHAKTKLADLRDIPASRKDPDWTSKQLIWATQQAEAWRLAGTNKPVSPRGVKLPVRDLTEILKATKWRTKYGLPNDDKMRKRFL